MNTTNTSNNTSTRHKYYDVIVAWANGEKIQYNPCNTRWLDFVFNDQVPGFNNENSEWRVKPKTITKRYCMALHHDGSIAAYDVTNTSIYDPVEYSIKGFIRWLGDTAEVETELI